MRFDADGAGAPGSNPRLRPELTRLSLVATAVWLVVTVAAATGASADIDRAGRLTWWLRSHLGDQVLKAVERPGQRVLVLPVLFAVTVTIAWRRRQPQPLIAAAVAAGLVNVTVSLVKVWSHRATPRLGGPEFFNPDSTRTLGAFPSGHATNVGMWATLAWFLVAGAQPVLRRWMRGGAVTGVAVISLCSWARSTHWVTDLLAGLALGCACACAGMLLAPKFDDALRAAVQRRTTSTRARRRD